MLRREGEERGGGEEEVVVRWEEREAVGVAVRGVVECSSTLYYLLLQSE